MPTHQKSTKRESGRRGRRERPTAALPPLRLAFLLTILLAALPLLGRISGNLWLAGSFWAAAAVLLIVQIALRVHLARTATTPRYELVPPMKVHYVQATMQSCVYAYWGWYWPSVYHYVPLIVAQLVFVYALDLLVSVWRRGTWKPGMGPFPIILSTNLFLWFKDDWFFLQFVMVAIGVLGKEFVRWTRDGRSTHIFNPSALPLFVASIGLIATHGTGITWGQEIATTIGRPPLIYIEIFLVGLVVQYLFKVTLVTLMSAAALFVLNVGYTGLTGTYYFIDTNIPVAVFLGLHLLVTDPATSPRTLPGKIVFGTMYGVGVFGLYELLGWLGAPLFYDKLLCVPLLNMTVRMLDRISRAAAESLRGWRWRVTWTPSQLNLAHMAVWVVLFLVMISTGFLTRTHPGADLAFWRRACEEGRWGGCRTWLRTLAVNCGDGSGEACDTRARLLSGGRLVARNVLEAGRNFDLACDLGVERGCDGLKALVRAEGAEVFVHACRTGDGPSCYIAGSLTDEGLGLPRNASAAVALFEQSCLKAWAPGCNRLGRSYLNGSGTAVDLTKAIVSFEKGCRGNNAAACFNAASMYVRGLGTSRDDELAKRRFAQACELGLEPACRVSRTAGRTF